MVALDTIKPHLTPDFVAAFKALGKQVGYSKLGRAIAYMQLPTEAAVDSTPNVSHYGHRRNGRKSPKPMYTHRGPRYPGCLRCQEDQAHRFTHNGEGPMRYSFLVEGTNLATKGSLQAIADALPKRECCGFPMGVMPDSLDPMRWRYQCAVDPKHQEDTEINIACSPS